jgi:hypothetical protein
VALVVISLFVLMFVVKQGRFPLASGFCCHFIVVADKMFKVGCGNRQVQASYQHVQQGLCSYWDPQLPTQYISTVCISGDAQFPV